MDTTKYKYKTIDGERHPTEDSVHSLNFDLHLLGQLISFGNKKYKVVGTPYKNEGDSFYTVELAQVKSQ
jgi:hypothetical protein